MEFLGKLAVFKKLRAQYAACINIRVRMKRITCFSFWRRLQPSLKNAYLKIISNEPSETYFLAGVFELQPSIFRETFKRCVHAVLLRWEEIRNEGPILTSFAHLEKAAELAAWLEISFSRRTMGKSQHSDWLQSIESYHHIMVCFLRIVLQQTKQFFAYQEQQWRWKNFRFSFPAIANLNKIWMSIYRFSTFLWFFSQSSFCWQSS